MSPERLLDHKKNHDQDYFGHYCDHDYLTLIIIDFVNHEMDEFEIVEFLIL